MKILFMFFLNLLTFGTGLLAADEASVIKGDIEYIKTNSELELMIAVAQDLGVKECRSDSGKLPRSVRLWFDEGKKLQDNERRRFNAYTREMSRIEKKMSDILAGQSSDDMQAQAALMQAEILSVELEFLGGKRGRIQSRIYFLTEINYAKSAASYEDKLWYEAFDKKLMDEGFNQSLEVAKKACREIDENEECTNAQEQIKLLKSSANNYKSAYQVKSRESMVSDLDLKEKEVNLFINSGGVTKSSDPSYDWITPSLKGIEAMSDVRKSITVSCPSSKESKAFEKSLKIAAIFEDKNKSPETKMEEMKKIDSAIANSLLGGSLTIESLKKMPLEWDRQNKTIGLPHDREPFIADIEKRTKELLESEKEKVELIKEKRGKILKILLAFGDLTKHKIDLDRECGANPHPGPIPCPGRTPNPLCDPDSSESIELSRYKSCRNRVIEHNQQITSISNTDEDIRNNPNVVAIESYYEGLVGPLWRAKIKNPDGTFRYERLIKGPSQGGDGSGFVGVQNDPNNKPSGTGGSGNGRTAKEEKPKEAKPKKAADEEKSEKTKKKREMSAEEKLLFNEQLEKLKNSNLSQEPVNLKQTCGQNPCHSIQIGGGLCTIDKEKIPLLKTYQACSRAVNEFNSMINAKINLSDYVKNHPEYVGIERSQETQLWMAKMKKTSGEIYYIPLNFEPKL